MSHFFKQIQTTIKSLGGAYNKTSSWCKILIFITLLLLLILVFKGLPRNSSVEGFEQMDKFLIKSGPEIYDKFYADIYDYLVFNNIKNDYEIGEIINKAHATSQSRILDVGCGTGHHVAGLGSKGIDVLGIDISTSMIETAKEHYPDYKFEVADALNSDEFNPESFTHILCMYFTIYYFKDKRQFFNNCMKWLMPSGLVIVHIVDRDRFDPILPPGNPLLYVSPQRYAKERITTTKVKFTDFSYQSEFKFDKENNVTKFIEKFKNDSDGKVRKNEHILYMPDEQEIVDEAQAAGFIIEGKVDLIHCQYEYQYLYIFKKPN